MNPQISQMTTGLAIIMPASSATLNFVTSASDMVVKIT